MSIVNSLPAYVDQTRTELIAKATLGSKSAERMTLQTGVKTQSAILVLNTEAPLQDGSACGWTSEGTSTISERVIKAPLVKVNMSFCEKDLLNKATQHDVRVAANQKNLPYEQEFVNGVVESVKKQKEKLIWQGDVTKTTDKLLKLGDGLLKILKSDVPTENKISGVTGGITSANVIAEVDKVFMAIPEEVLEKAEIWLGTDVYRLYVKALQDKNLYHYAGEGIDKMETFYPGSDVKIVALPGLSKTGCIVAGDPANFYYGTDMSGDEEKFELFYSKDNREFRLAIEFTMGANVAFPDQVVLYVKTA